MFIFVLIFRVILFLSIFIELIGVTLVSKIIQVQVYILQVFFPCITDKKVIVIKARDDISR